MSQNGNKSLPECAVLEPAPFLFSEQTISELTEAERRGEYNLERLRKLRPEVEAEIIRLTGEWCGQLRIAKMLHVHHRTVAAVIAANPEAVEESRQRRVARLRTAADLQVEQLLENPENVPWNVKGLVASQLYDKAELLDGKPTSIEERRHVIDIYSDWPQVIEKYLPSGEAIDIAPVNDAAIGSEAGKKSAISDSFANAVAALPSSAPGMEES